MIDTKAMRDTVRTGRAELLQRVQLLCDEVDHLRQAITLLEGGLAASLHLPGWFCVCGVFNGEAKRERETCRACDKPKPGVTP